MSVLRKVLNDGRVTVQIGTCAGTPEAADYVIGVLGAACIEVYPHGSRVYAIEVLEADVKRAQVLLRRDRNRDQYRIRLYGDSARRIVSFAGGSLAIVAASLGLGYGWRSRPLFTPNEIGNTRLVSGIGSLFHSDASTP